MRAHPSVPVVIFLVSFLSVPVVKTQLWSTQNEGSVSGSGLFCQSRTSQPYANLANPKKQKPIYIYTCYN